MSDDALPKPEPKEIDEKLALQLKHLAEDAVLKGQPYGDEKCGNCLYYLNTDDKIAYCCLDCAKCDAYLATGADLQTKTVLRGERYTAVFIGPGEEPATR